VPAALERAEFSFRLEVTEMRSLKVLLVLAAALFVATPVFAATVFYDDFESGTAWNLIGSVPPAFGSWSLNGGSLNDSDFYVYWSPASNHIPDSHVFGGSQIGGTVMNGYDFTHGTPANIDAQFAAQSSASTRVRFEAEFYGQIAGATPVDLKLAMLSGTTEVGGITLSGGSSVGTVVFGGAPTALTYSIDAWHHLTMDYLPTTATFSVAIDGQTPLTGLAMTTPSAVDGFRFAQTSGATAGSDRWSVFDNVSVTTSTVPEPTTLTLLASGLLGLLAYAWKKRG
jgi:hypothetical protein